ncbi:Rne/Rng family ribonuclease [Defluviitalea phaphyphila]|uniref:Rne/Rng family ribonuclease n=1 Tax=Defluviitalea phaphyphila TaxID=1473580 RepID=UPI0007315DED|nr:Rne/Rng family ribonuclease [Defluviitalea phaphyphila]
MNTDIIVEVDVNRTRIGVVEDQKLVEIYIDENNIQKTVGNIYRGVVKKILPGIEAAFIDIGQKKNGYLSLKELGDTKLKQGDNITVQVEKEAMGTKGPKLTLDIGIPGKYMVLTPKNNTIGISKKIEDEKERYRLKQIFEKYKPEDCGVIIRTDSINKTEEELIKEINYLKQIWINIHKKEPYVIAPTLLYKEASLAIKIARDLLSFKIRNYIVNNKKTYKEVYDFVNIFAPNLKDKIIYKEEEHLFQHFFLESQIEKALSKHVWLKSGGMIIIEHTEALTVIDVNTAKYVGKKDIEKTILNTNIEAAKEIAKQLRLRNIGGIIIIDFIDMKSKENKKKVIEILKQELKKDRVKSSVLGITRLGLVELTRKKTGPSLTSLLFSKCNICNGRGMIPSVKYIGSKIEKEIDFIFTHTIYNNIIIEANKEIINWFNSKEYSYKKAIEKKYKKNLVFVENNSLLNEEYKIIKK